VTKLSLSRAWDETKNVLARDGKLIAAVGLALVVFPQTLAGLFAPQEGQDAARGSMWVLTLSIIVAIVAQAALNRLAIGPSTTVGEAIRRAFRRTPALLAAFAAQGEVIALIDPARFRALAEMSRSLNVWNVPTMYLWENFYNDRTPEELGALPEMQYAHPRQVQGWMNQKRGRSRADSAQRMTPERRARYLELRRMMLKTLADAGAPLLMGTDSPQMFNVPGFALHRELQVAHAAGLTNYQVLESGTRNVGRYVSESLKEDGAFGTVAAGQWADLVLLEANPLEDLAHLRRRAGVIVRGRWVSASEIQTGLHALAAKYAALR